MTISNRRALGAALIGCCCVLLAPATRAQSAAPPIQVLDRIVAVVNDGVVLASDLEAELRNVRRQLRQQNRTLPDTETLRGQVLERLILRSVQVQRALSLGLRIDDSALNRTLEDLARQNNLSLAQFRDALVAEGYDYRRFREDIRTELLVNQLRRREVASRLNVTDQEIEDELAELALGSVEQLERRVRQIFVAVPEGSTPATIGATEQRARQILARLEEGADFAELATRVSEDERALDGGDLGWRSNAQLPALFAEALATMRAGQVSPVLRSPIGFHILKLEAVRGEERHIVRQTLARHMLLRVTPVRDDDQARQALAELRRRVLLGEDFAALARAYSEDTVSASVGGELPWFGEGVMDPSFEEVARNLPIGHTSEPFRSRFGWHLVQVLDRRSEDNTEEFKRDRARNQIRQRKLEIETETWLRRLRDEAYVELRLEGAAN